MPVVSEAGPPRPADLRVPVLGLSAWVGALLGLLLPSTVLVGLVAVMAVALAVLRRRFAAPVGTTALGMLIVLGAVGTVAALQRGQTAHNPVADLAARGAAVTVEATVTSDPRTIHGRFADQVLVQLQVRQVTGRGTTTRLHEPVLMLGSTAWSGVRLGEDVRATGTLAPADDRGESALLDGAGAPVHLADPSVWWRAGDGVRRSLRDSVRGRPPDQRALVPALVDGDDGGLDPALAADFKTTGLTHLLAVSGTNLTLVVGFLLILARWCRVRGRWLLVVGALGTAGFVIVARTEPSVLRAAVMGGVGLLAMGSNGRQRALRGLGVAVVVLLLIDPGLAVTVGFALSVLATMGILVLAPGWRDALATWLPRWVAEAIAVPAAAQLACTPLVAAISGQISLVAVAANLLAEPAVGPATVLGLLGGLTGLVLPPVGRLFGTTASWCVAWIVTVARHTSGLPTAAIGWGSGAVALVVLTVLCLLLAALAPRLLRRRRTGVVVVVVALLVALVRFPTPGWPPGGWVMVACDVGQGDGLVLNAGPHTGIVVDAGPDPAPMEQCLDRLGITQVPLVVLTHFHADHVDGLPGVLAGRHVQQIWVTRLLDPPEGVEEVRQDAAAAGVPVTTAPYSGTVTYGAVTLQVLWPLPDSPVVGPGDGSTANEASIVMLAVVRGVRILLTGDVEPEGQTVLAQEYPGLQVQVLKIPHHGSRYQDEDWLLSLHPSFAIASVGIDNDYGHPAASTLDPLTAAGVDVRRTDHDGSVAVVEDGSGVHLVQTG